MEKGEDLDYDDGSAGSRYWSNWTTDYLEDLDTSLYPFPNSLWHVKPAKEIAIKTSCMLVIGVFGLFCNFVILYVIVKNKWLWSPSNYLLWNMVFMDFLTLLFCPWFMLVRDFYQNYVLKNFGCRFEGFLQVRYLHAIIPATLLLASVGALFLVSYDRLAAAALTAEAKVTKKVAPKLIVVTWLVSGLLSLPWIINRTFTVRQWLDYVEMFCVEDPTVLGIYWHFVMTLLVWIPLGVMSITYGAIMWRIECSVRELSSRTGVGSGDGGGRTMARVRGRAMRITALVLLAGVICRLPYTVLLYWRNNMDNGINVVDGSFSNMWFAANFLMYSNSALNPLLFGFTNLRFRKAMDRTMPFALCKFGSWCCVFPTITRKQTEQDDKNTEKIFVIENSPKPNKRLTTAIKHIFHIHRVTIELSGNKNDEITTKPTRVTPLRDDNV